MYLKLIGGIKKIVNELSLISNNFIGQLITNLTNNRTWQLPDRSGNVALIDDINSARNYGYFTGLKSNYYLIGGNLAITPKVESQTGVFTYWGMQCTTITPYMYS